MAKFDFKKLERDVEERLEVIFRDEILCQRYGVPFGQNLNPNRLRQLHAFVTSEILAEMMQNEDTGPIVDEMGTVLAGRFELVKPIGRGSQGRTFLARDLDKNRDVVVKALDIADAEDWKAIELFERESETLEKIDIKGVPKWIDNFSVEGPLGKRMFIVQEFVDGSDLRVLSQNGPWGVVRCRQLIRQIMGILGELHRQRPPIIHRDIKPSNIIERRDGGFSLVDFGTVQTIAPTTIGGTTITGTPGYMPLEQLMGKAVPASDFYALAATIVFMNAHVHPADLELENGRPKLEGVVDAELVSLLTSMMEPAAENRASRVQILRYRGPQTTDIAVSQRHEIAPHTPRVGPLMVIIGLSLVVTFFIVTVLGFLTLLV